MALQEKIMKLSPEQREKLFAVKDEAVLDAFVSEHGIELTAEERSEALVYLNKHEMPLSDEELDNVAGGGSRTPDDTLLGLEPNHKCNLWEGKHGQKSSLMKTNDTHTLYTISEEATHELTDLMK